MEVTDTFKYLGVTLDTKLTFGLHVQGVYKKCQQRLYLLRKLRPFHVETKPLLLLYMSSIESMLTYCIICFFPAMSVSSKNTLLCICKTASKITGLPTQPVCQTTERAMIKKAHAFANDRAHPLNTEFDLLPSQRRYRCPKCRKEQVQKHFRSSYKL